MIKFRAWDKVQNKMLLPDNIEFSHGKAYWADASTDGNEDDEYSNDGEVDAKQQTIKDAQSIRDYSDQAVKSVSAK